TRVGLRGTAEGGCAGARGEARAPQDLAEDTRLRKDRGGNAWTRSAARCAASRHQLRQGSRHREVHQGSRLEGRAAPGPRRPAAREWQEAGRPAAGDPVSEGSRLRDPVAVHELPRLIGRCPCHLSSRAQPKSPTMFDANPHDDHPTYAFDRAKRPYRVTPAPVRTESPRATATRQVTLIDFVYAVIVIASGIAFVNYSRGSYFLGVDWQLAERGGKLGDFLKPLRGGLGIPTIGAYRTLYKLVGF